MMRPDHLAAQRRPRSAQRGVSLVEMMVAAALGLVVVAAALSLVAAQTQERRREALAQRLLQELRTAADIAARDLRRAGFWGDAGAAVGAGTVNPYAVWTAAGSAASYAYSRDLTENGVVDSNEAFGLRLQSGVLQLRLGDAGWQALTDAGTLRVTAFTLTPTVETVSLAAHCLADCSAPACTPALTRRRLVLRIAARSVADASIERVLRHELRSRNDLASGACPA